MEKNDTAIVTAQGLGTQGEGVAKCEDLTLFIPYLLKGERAQVKIVKVKGNTGYGKVLEILAPAEERVRPKCPVFSRCGGCQLQHLRYRDQLKFKQDLVRDTLKKIAGIEAEVSPCVRSEREYGYRNKLQMPVGGDGEKTAVGFYAERSHRIVETDDCPLHPAWVKALIAALKNFMEKCGLDGYDEEKRRGHVRHIVVRELKKGVIVTLVTTVREIKGIDYFCHLLDGIFPEYSLYLNFNDKNTNVVFGSAFTLVRGKGIYEGNEGGIEYEAGPNTFVQVNDGVREKLYERAVSLVGEGDTVVDCYAGGGLLTAMFAQKCRFAYGIEVVPEAVACADALKMRNKLEDRMQNLCGRVEDRLREIPDLGRATVVLDPPRTGVARSVLKEIKTRGVEKIVMISCNPATLARDLGYLTGTLAETESGELVKTENGHTMYEIDAIEPFDMFPQTRHVETLVALHRAG